MPVSALTLLLVVAVLITLCSATREAVDGSGNFKKIRSSTEAVLKNWEVEKGPRFNEAKKLVDKAKDKTGNIKGRKRDKKRKSLWKKTLKSVNAKHDQAKTAQKYEMPTDVDKSAVPKSGMGSARPDSGSRRSSVSLDDSSDPVLNVNPKVSKKPQTEFKKGEASDPSSSEPSSSGPSKDILEKQKKKVFHQGIANGEYFASDSTLSDPDPSVESTVRNKQVEFKQGIANGEYFASDDFSDQSMEQDLTRAEYKQGIANGEYFASEPGKPSSSPQPSTNVVDENDPAQTLKLKQANFKKGISNGEYFASPMDQVEFKEGISNGEYFASDSSESGSPSRAADNGQTDSETTPMDQGEFKEGIANGEYFASESTKSSLPSKTKNKDPARSPMENDEFDEGIATAPKKNNSRKHKVTSESPFANYEFDSSYKKFLDKSKAILSNWKFGKDQFFKKTQAIFRSAKGQTAALNPAQKRSLWVKTFREIRSRMLEASMNKLVDSQLENNSTRANLQAIMDTALDSTDSMKPNDKLNTMQKALKEMRQVELVAQGESAMEQLEDLKFGVGDNKIKSGKTMLDEAKDSHSPSKSQLALKHIRKSAKDAKRQENKTEKKLKQIVPVLTKTLMEGQDLDKLEELYDDIVDIGSDESFLELQGYAGLMSECEDLLKTWKFSHDEIFLATKKLYSDARARVQQSENEDQKKRLWTRTWKQMQYKRLEAALENQISSWKFDEASLEDATIARNEALASAAHQTDLNAKKSALRDGMKAIRQIKKNVGVFQRAEMVSDLAKTMKVRFGVGAEMKKQADKVIEHAWVKPKTVATWKEAHKKVKKLARASEKAQKKVEKHLKEFDDKLETTLANGTDVDELGKVLAKARAAANTVP